MIMKTKFKYFEKDSIPLIINNNKHVVKNTLEIREKQNFAINFLNNQFAPAIKQWANGIYNFNKNFIKNIPATDLIVNKIITSYFSINPIITNPRGKKTRLLIRRYKRLSLNTIIVSKPEIKHNNDNVFITVYLYNKQKKSIFFIIKNFYSNLTFKKRHQDSARSINLNIKKPIQKNLGLKKKLIYKNLSLKYLFYTNIHKSNILKKPLIEKKSIKIANKYLNKPNTKNIGGFKFYEASPKNTINMFNQVNTKSADYNIILDNKAKLSNIKYYILSLKNLNSICKIPLNNKINIKHSSIEKFNEKNKYDLINKTMKKKLTILGNTILRGYDYNYQTMFNNISTIALLNKMFNNNFRAIGFKNDIINYKGINNINIYEQLPLNTLFLNPIVRVNKKSFKPINNIKSYILKDNFKYTCYIPSLRKKYLNYNNNNTYYYEKIKKLTKNNIYEFLGKNNHNKILPLIEEKNESNYINFSKLKKKIIKHYYISLNKYKISNQIFTYYNNVDLTREKSFVLHENLNNKVNLINITNKYINKPKVLYNSNNNELNLVNNISKKLINNYITNILKNGVSQFFINLKLKPYTTKYTNKTSWLRFKKKFLKNLNTINIENYPKIKKIISNNDKKFNINFLSKFNYVKYSINMPSEIILLKNTKSSILQEWTEGLYNKHFIPKSKKPNKFLKTKSISFSLLQTKKIDFLQPYLKNSKGFKIPNETLDKNSSKISKKTAKNNIKTQYLNSNYFNYMQYKYNIYLKNKALLVKNTKTNAIRKTVVTMYKLKTLYNIFSIYNSNLKTLEFRNKVVILPTHSKFENNRCIFNKSLISVSDLFNNSINKQIYNFNNIYYNEIIWNTYNLLNKSKTLIANKKTNLFSSTLQKKDENIIPLNIETSTHFKDINYYIKSQISKKLEEVKLKVIKKQKKFNTKRSKIINFATKNKDIKNSKNNIILYKQRKSRLIKYNIKQKNKSFNIFKNIENFFNKYNSVLEYQNTILTNRNIEQKNIADTSTYGSYLSNIAKPLDSKYVNTLTNNNLENKYKLEYIKEILSNDLLYLYYLKLLAYNDIIFKNWFLNMLIIILSKLYNKNVIINLISLKNMYFNSDIFMQVIATRIKNIAKFLPKLVIGNALNIVNLGVMEPAFFKSEVFNKFKNYHIKQDFVKKPSIFNFLGLNINNNFNLKKIKYQNHRLNNITSLYTKNNIYSDINKNTYNLKNIHPNIINFIKYKAVFGVKLVTSGRLTRRSTASKSIFRINFKGSMKNNINLNQSNSNLILKNNRTSNLQFTKISSKTRNGSFGIKGWINNS